MAISYFTLVYSYGYPAQILWDETYFVAAVQRYLGGYMFMENHPPLGKLLMTFGEYLLHPNAGLDLSALTKTDTVSELPGGYSMAGIRFMPVVFAWMSCLVFYTFCGVVLRRPWPAFALSLPYVLQNAVIRHFQSAMLDGIQICFLLCALAVLASAWRCEPGEVQTKHNLSLGFFLGCALSVKMNAIVFLLVPPILAFRQAAAAQAAARTRVKHWIHSMWTMGATLTAVFFLSWYVHFSIGTKVIGDEYFGASESYKSILASNATSSLLAFPIMLRDSFNFSVKYNRGVPRLNECDPNENGSAPVRWLVGGKTIKYGWTSEGNKTRYFYLVPNPIGWWYGTASIALAIALIIGGILYRTPIEDRDSFSLLCLITLLYSCYMAMLSQMERAMYLYHYFVPLVLSLVAGVILFRYLFESEFPRRKFVVNCALLLFSLQIAGGFLYMRKLTYGLPVAPYEVLERAWLATWQLEPNR